MMNDFPYRARAMFAFEEQDGVDVCFFGMHVQVESHLSHRANKVLTDVIIRSTGVSVLSQTPGESTSPTLTLFTSSSRGTSGLLSTTRFC